ncbi:MAG: hypothetical protein PVI23_03940 [Maricaulaceae bacterium]|jgi:hypothetical protein
MSDDFLKEHQADWLAQHGTPDEFEAVRAKLRSERWRPQRTLVLESAAALVGATFGAGFAWVSIKTGSVLYALAAIVMLAGLPGAMAINVFLRREGFAWDDETPESLLCTGLKRTNAALRAAHFSWAAPGLFLAFVIALWTGVALGYIAEAWFAVTYTFFTALVFAASWIGIRRAVRRLRRERATYARLLAEFEGDKPAGTPTT